jgi:hypothetical protein
VDPAASTSSVQAQDSNLITQSSNLTTQPSQLITQDGNLLFRCDDRHYRIRGLEKNTSSTTLKVNLMVSREALVHLDSLDLVKARSRAAFVKAAASELFVDDELVKKDLGRLLLQLETLQADRIDKLKKTKTTHINLSEQEQRDALALRRIDRKARRLSGRHQPQTQASAGDRDPVLLIGRQDVLDGRDP